MFTTETRRPRRRQTFSAHCRKGRRERDFLGASRPLRILSALCGELYSLCVLRVSVVILLHRRLRPQNYRALRRQDAAIAVRDRGFRAGHLACAGIAAQLPHRLDQEEEPVHAGMAIGEAAAIGVDREPAARGDMSVFDKAAALTLRAKPEVFEE